MGKRDRDEKTTKATTLSRTQKYKSPCPSFASLGPGVSLPCLAALFIRIRFACGRHSVQPLLSRSPFRRLARRLRPPPYQPRSQTQRRSRRAYCCSRSAVQAAAAQAPRGSTTWDKKANKREVRWERRETKKDTTETHFSFSRCDYERHGVS